MRQKHLTLAFTAIALSLCSCSKSIDEVIEPTEKRAVEIFTRSSSAASIEYPLTLYAFSSDGTLKESTTANNAEASLQMQLPVGDSYRLVALAGARGLTPVTTPTASTDIGIPTSGLITSPIQMGQAVINTITTDVEANITLSYQVAQLTIQLRNIPTDATAANVTLTSLYTNKNFEGTLSGKGTITVPLAKAANATTWEASTVYTLPGIENTGLVVGINIVTNNKTQNYSYTHNSTLQAGTPYSLIGTYDGEFNLTGTITPTGWNASEDISFSFGAENLNNGGNNNSNNGGTNGGDVYDVEELPNVNTLWNNQFVARVTPTDNSTAELLLLNRLKEWEVTKGEIESSISGYTEYNLGDWRVPTEEELTYLSTNYTSINGIISSMGKKLTGSYFCGDGTRYINIENGQAGNVETGKFKLRLVKTVTVSVQ